MPIFLYSLPRTCWLAHTEAAACIISGLVSSVRAQSVNDQLSVLLSCCCKLSGCCLVFSLTWFQFTVTFNIIYSWSCKTELLLNPYLISVLHWLEENHRRIWPFSSPLYSAPVMLSRWRNLCKCIVIRTRSDLPDHIWRYSDVGVKATCTM